MPKTADIQKMNPLKNLLMIPFGILTLMVCVSSAFATPQFSWDELCAVDVCRATGHDGVYNVDIAPDSTRLAVEVKRADKSGIYIIESDGQSRWLSTGNQPQWLPDGEQILYLLNNNLYIYSLSKQTSTAITTEWNDIHSAKVSPDGRYVAFASFASNAHEIYLLDLSNELPASKLTKNAMPKDEVRLGFSWSPDSQHIAFFSNLNDEHSDDLWIINVSTQQQTLLTNDMMGHGEPAFSPDGKHIAFYATPKSGTWYSELMDIVLVDIQSIQNRVIDMQITAREPGSPVWSRDGQNLFFPNHSRGSIELWTVAAKGGVATRITHNGGLIHDWDMSQDGSQFAVVRSTAIRGREVELMSSIGGSPILTTEFSTNWKGVVEPEEVSFKANDGMYIQGFVFYPPDFDDSQTYPALVQVHGGGTHSYYNGLNLVEQRLAQLGYVVIAVNYRGGSGFGRKFQDLGINDWANTQALDAAASAQFIRQQKWSNNKVGIYGYSYGGIISLAAVARAPDAFDAAVPMGGIYDFASAYENENRLIRLFIRYGHSGTPVEQSQHYDISNTIKRLDAVKTPILLMHGEKDSIAPFNQFVQAREALEKHGKTFESHSYANEPHRFREVANRVDMYTRLEAWMDKYLKTP